MVLTETDFLRNDRISDTATASSSKVPTHTQHKSIVYRFFFFHMTR